MPAGVFVTIDATMAEVEVPHPQRRREIGTLLVAAARPFAWLVETRTVNRPVPTFRAPVEIVAAAGLIDEPTTPEPFDDRGLAGGEGLTVTSSSPDPEPVLSADSAAQLVAPPRTGRGSTVAAWQEFLTGQAIAWEPGDNRAALIARWDSNHDRRTGP